MRSNKIIIIITFFLLIIDFIKKSLKLQNCVNKIVLILIKSKKKKNNSKPKCQKRINY